MVYDIGIIGAGPAGVTAGIYAARSGKNVIIFDGNGYGGRIASTPCLENYPGFMAGSGMQLMEEMHAQLEAYPNISEEFCNIVRVYRKEQFFELVLETEDLITCKAVIVATGSYPRELSLDTDDIYYCVTCDGPLFKGKDVIVVGSGNTGATYALELANYCNAVYLCDVADRMLCEPILKERVGKSTVKWYPESTVTRVVNDENGRLQAVVLSTGVELKCNGIFAATGMLPKNECVKDLVTLDNNGYIVSDETCLTSCEGIFVAGDCRTKKLRQAVTATADGAVAAVAACRYVDAL